MNILSVLIKINSQDGVDDSQNVSHCFFDNMFDLYETLASITSVTSHHCLYTYKDADR